MPTKPPALVTVLVTISNPTASLSVAEGIGSQSDSRMLNQKLSREISCGMVLLVLRGCGITPTKFNEPNGRTAYSMSCGNDLDACYEKAGELCLDGYDIMAECTHPQID